MTLKNDWIYFSDEKLLKMRICDLGLDLEHSELKEHTEKLLLELESNGIPLRPTFYLGDEWFSPEGVTAIALPFYLAHPRLKSLEQNMMTDVEGGTPDSCIKLLRHEAGHCFDHAFRVSKREKWKKTFGSPDQEYNPDNYKPHPYSKSFVKHIPNGYAQSHPDEDFAETFAVWLTPTLDWRREYESWPIALKKLIYVESLVKEFSAKNLKNKIHLKKPTKRDLPYSVTNMKSTLEKYYQKRKREYAQDLPDFFDTDLKRILKTNAESSLEKFIKQNKKILLESLTTFTGEKKVSIQNLLNRLIKRSDELKLKVNTGDLKTTLELTAFLASIISNYKYTGRYKPKKIN